LLLFVLFGCRHNRSLAKIPPHGGILFLEMPMPEVIAKEKETFLRRLIAMFKEEFGDKAPDVFGQTVRISIENYPDHWPATH
jgi:hypothetical protein